MNDKAKLFIQIEAAVQILEALHESLRHDLNTLHWLHSLDEQEPSETQTELFIDDEVPF